MKEIVEALRMRLPGRPAIGVTIGLSGTGKTQILLKYAYDHDEDYDYILFIDASSRETLEKSLVKMIDRQLDPANVGEAMNLLVRLQGPAHVQLARHYGIWRATCIYSNCLGLSHSLYKVSIKIPGFRGPIQEGPSRETGELRNQHKDTLKANYWSVLSTFKQGRYIEAEELLKDVAAGTEQMLGAPNADTLYAQDRVACVSAERANLEDMQIPIPNSPIVEARPMNTRRRIYLVGLQKP